MSYLAKRIRYFEEKAKEHDMQADVYEQELKAKECYLAQLREIESLKDDLLRDEKRHEEDKIFYGGLIKDRRKIAADYREMATKEKLENPIDEKPIS